jgi:hypothetical protein
VERAAEKRTVAGSAPEGDRDDDDEEQDGRSEGMPDHDHDYDHDHETCCPGGAAVHGLGAGGDSRDL